MASVGTGVDFYVSNAFTMTGATAPYLITSGSSANATWVPSMGAGGGIYQPSYTLNIPPATPPTALEWLDAEIEKTCALARVA